jgi:ABC-type nitrate/sulfonate/bicarbonate transport system permease component
MLRQYLRPGFGFETSSRRVQAFSSRLPKCAGTIFVMVLLLYTKDDGCIEIIRPVPNVAFFPVLIYYIGEGAT